MKCSCRKLSGCCHAEPTPRLTWPSQFRGNRSRAPYGCCRADVKVRLELIDRNIGKLAEDRCVVQENAQRMIGVQVTTDSDFVPVGGQADRTLFLDIGNSVEVVEEA